MQSFRSGDLNLAYIDVPAGEGPGEGAPILLIHGFASTHAVNWVNTMWVKTLTHAGYRVVAFDNRGHGQSDKPHRAEDYSSDIMAQDAKALLDHLRIERADVMGYSMGARITAHLALSDPQRVRSALLGGLGIHLVEGVGLPLGIADAMETPSLADLTDPMQRMFRAFADANKADLKALAACIRGSRQTLSKEQVGAIKVPVLISVGTEDSVAGSGPELAALIPGAQALDIPGRDHNLAVGDRVHKQGVIEFLSRRP